MSAPGDFLPAAAFETSVRRGSIGLRIGATTRAHTLDEGQGHARDLVPVLEGLLEEQGLRPNDLRTLVVGTGPGSFTGLRVAIATAQGLSRAVGAQLVGVPSMAAMAWRALHSSTGRSEASLLLDAHGGAFYHARYGLSGEELVTLREPELVPTAELEVALEEESFLALDDETFRRKLPEVLSPRAISCAPPDAAALLELGRARFDLHGADDPRTIEPLYLRPFAAKTRRR